MAVEYSYTHRQPGYVAAGVMGAGLLLAGRYLVRGGPAAFAMIPVLAVVGGAALMMSSFTVEIEDGVLRSHFGPGLPARKVKINDIESVEVVKNPWYYGWGIRWTPRGTLYNVSGLDAVEVRLRNGSRFRLGTDEPEALRAAIETAKREVPREFS